MSDGTAAAKSSSNSVAPRPIDLLAYHGGDWKAAPYPAYGEPNLWAFLVPSLPDRDDDPWTVVERSGDTVVLELHNRTRQGDDLDGRHRLESRHEITVDADTGRPQRLVTTVPFGDYVDGEETDRWRVRIGIEFQQWGAVDVQRPEPLGPRGALEWFWDLAYY